MSSPIEGIVIREHEQLEALAHLWWALWRRIPGATPFQSPAWLLAWWPHFRPGRLATIAVAYGDRLIGLAPGYIEEGIGGCRLLPIGISISDYLDVLVDPEFAGIAEAAIARAAPGAADWDRWELEELPPGAAGLRLPCPAGCNSELSEQSACPMLLLPDRDAEFRDVVTGKQRRNLNLARNRARRAGNVEFVSVGATEVPQFLLELRRLHQARWERRDTAGVLADPRVIAFHEHAAPELLRLGLARFHMVVLDGRAIAVAYLLVTGPRWMIYLSGFDPAHAFESPGQLLLAHVVESALREGAHEIDFLRGREDYKLAWTRTERINLKRSFMRDRGHG
jgi:CelD/BcsL family acetyltransferase involved in cellulose biosynthesis